MPNPTKSTGLCKYIGKIQKSWSPSSRILLQVDPPTSYKVKLVYYSILIMADITWAPAVEPEFQNMSTKIKSATSAYMYFQKDAHEKVRVESHQGKNNL